MLWPAHVQKVPQTDLGWSVLISQLFLLETSSSSAFPSYISGVHHFGWDFCACGHFFNPTIEAGACWVCFCCRHSLVLDMRVGIYWVHAMECLYFLIVCTGDLGLYSHPKEFLRYRVRTHINSKQKIPSLENFSSEEDGTHASASSRTASLTHYQRAILALGST